MLRKPHGRANGAGLPGPRVEVAPDTRQALCQPRAPGAYGRAKGKPPVIVQAAQIVAHEDAQPYLASGYGWRDHVIADFTERFGAVGAAESAVIESAALELAASRYVMARAMKLADMAENVEAAGPVADLMLRASRLAAASRQNTMAAWEMLVRSLPEGDEDGPIDADEATAAAERRTAERRKAGG